MFTLAHNTGHTATRLLWTCRTSDTVAATSAAGQAHIQVDGSLAGTNASD
jgi:hypothetical protein